MKPLVAGGILVTLTLALVVAGCGSTRSVSRDLAVTNETDRFRIQIAEVEGFTEMLEYQWTTTGSVATVIQAGELREGTAHIEIRDPTDFVVHAKSLRGPGTFVTSAGRPGIWRVRIDLEKATGSVDVTVQRPG